MSLSREEIIRMAREAGEAEGMELIFHPVIERLANAAYAAGAAAERACAQLCEPKSKRPCDCESCYCQNSGDLADVSSWDDATRLAKAIRAREQK